MKLLSPAYRLTIGERVVDTTREPRESTVVDLTVDLDLDAPADSCTLLLGNVDGLVPARGDHAKVELGYAEDGGLTLVLTGTIVEVHLGLVTSRLVVHSPAAALLRTFADQTYESKSAGAIVRDLAGRASVDVARADDGTQLPAYVVDGRRAVYHHLHDLAELCGFDLYLDPEGKLVFERFADGRTVHVFEYAKHMLELEESMRPPAADSIEAWGESPGTGRGEEAWAWLVKDFRPSLGTAGSGGTKLLLERPVLRTAEAARTAAEAAFTAVGRRALRGRVTGLGRPEVTLGDAVRLRGVPRSDLNGLFQVRAVRHRIVRDRGFTTVVMFRGAG
jgi:phage protein D